MCDLRNKNSSSRQNIGKGNYLSRKSKGKTSVPYQENVNGYSHNKIYVFY
jgi:hypothetical protein